MIKKPGTYTSFSGLHFTLWKISFVYAEHTSDLAHTIMGVIKDKGEFLNKNYITLLEMFNPVQTIFGQKQQQQKQL